MSNKENNLETSKPVHRRGYQQFPGQRQGLKHFFLRQFDQNKLERLLQTSFFMHETTGYLQGESYSRGSRFFGRKSFVRQTFGRHACTERLVEQISLTNP
jgi:hypothetical protein